MVELAAKALAWPAPYVDTRGTGGGRSFAPLRALLALRTLC